MTLIEQGELRVVIPVGFLLTETREVTVSVDRPGAAPLPVRVRLVPAQPAQTDRAALAEAPEESVSVSAPTPPRIAWPKRVAFDGGPG